MTQGCNPYLILGSYFFFLAVINLFDITKRSKWLNRIGNTGNPCKSYTVVGALAYMFFYLRNRYMGSNRPRRGGRALGCPMTGDSARAPGTACTAPAQPPTAVLGPLKLQCLNKIGQQIAVGIWVSYVTSCYVISCSVCAGSGLT